MARPYPERQRRVTAYQMEILRAFDKAIGKSDHYADELIAALLNVANRINEMPDGHDDTEQS